jgi:hypothetical protein
MNFTVDFTVVDADSRHRPPHETPDLGMDTETRQFSARTARDDQVHRVEAPSDALLDPSPYRTRCHRPVFEIYNAAIPITCPDCAGQGTPLSTENRTRR